MHRSLSLASVLVCLAVVCLPAITRASPGDLYVTTFGNQVLKFSPNGTQSTYASNFNVSQGIAFDSSGNLFVSNGQNPAEILKFTPNGTESTFASGLNNVFGVAFDKTGNLFVTSNPSVIYKFAPDGTRTTFATGLDGPIGIAFNNAGNLFVADRGSNSILEFTPSGQETTFASGLNVPVGVAFDSAGNLFVTNYGTGTQPGDGSLVEIAPDDTKTVLFQHLYVPWGLAFDNSGNLFMALQNGNIIKIAPDHMATNFASGINSSLFNLAFEGTALPVPEPSTGAVLMLGASLAALSRGTRRKR
jgi:sugar lactone lactonase YvrE